jgi:hypothetical protein
MGKRIVAWSVLICCSLTSAAETQTADDYVVAGRQHLHVRTTCALTGDQEIDGRDLLALADKALLVGQFALQFGTPLAWPDAADTALLEGSVPDVIEGVVAAIRQAGDKLVPEIYPRENKAIYIDIDPAACLEKLHQKLIALGDFFLRSNSDLQAVETFDVYDAEAILLGRLTLAYGGSHGEGAGGRMVLADGRALEVEWFGELDEDQVGVSLFAADWGLEGWFEGTVDRARNVISDGTLDLWSTIGLIGTDVSPTFTGAPAYLDATLDWTKTAWAQLREVLTPVPAGGPAAP